MSGYVKSLADGAAGSSIRPGQQGAIAIMFALMLAVLMGFIGLSLDLGRVYNRKLELQAAANSAALAAARQLNGTAAGVANALAQAATAVGQLKYRYNQLPITWNDAAMSFSATPTGGWVDAAAAQGGADGLMFTKVDTGKLDATLGAVDLFFMRVLSTGLASVNVSGAAVAGRSTLNVTPLAICAMSIPQAAPRVNPGPPAYTELVEFGFRRGVSYDLMQLNPNGTSAVNFVIDPVDPPGVAGTAANTSSVVTGPYVCTGRLAMPRVTGGPITVSQPFPLGALFNQLNSRFDQYVGGLCSPMTAPPDYNIKSYLFGSAVPWMNAAPVAQAAQSTTAGGELWTVADPLPAPAGTTAAMFGPLWAYARAVQYAASEPAGGYVSLNPSAWSSLYKPGQPVAAGTYPATSANATPYSAGAAQFPSVAHRWGVPSRRVLNVPLLSCPVAAGTATVLGIGRFFMMVPATSTKLYAEFGGAVAEQSLGGQVELYR